MLSERSSGAERAGLLNQQTADLDRSCRQLSWGRQRWAGAKKTPDNVILYPCCSKEDVAMRTTFDFAPLFRSSIGFDRMLNALETASRVTSVDNWPPYDNRQDR
jgi:molecular chaperone IbpA